jgi:outer membrane protein
MKIRLLSSSCVIAALPALVSADVLSFAIGGGAWNETPSGSIIKPSNAITPDVDAKSDLFWDEESQGYLFATLEHPVPLLPNVRLMYTKIDHTGSGDTTFEFDGQIYGPSNVANDFTIEQTDLVFYYEVLDNVVSLDLGLNVRLLDIAYKIDDGSSNTDGSVSAPVPMVYGLIGGSPWPGLMLSAEGSFISYSGNTLSDFTARISYTTDFFVGFEAGYRTQTIELDDVDDTNANLDFKGPFLGAYLKF